MCSLTHTYVILFYFRIISPKVIINLYGHLEEKELHGFHVFGCSYLCLIPSTSPLSPYCLLHNLSAVEGLVTVTGRSSACSLHPMD